MFNKKYFLGSYIFTFFGLILGALVGWYYNNNIDAAIYSMFIVFVLSILEVSISFDNAVVNASVLKKMTPLWQHRFLTWGMLIAVFGMRLIFPLLIVAVTAHVGPVEALKMAAFNPDQYAQMMLSVEHEVASFGGAFLLLVALKYFIDIEKETHWIRFLEIPLSKIGHLEAIEVGITILVLLLLSQIVPDQERLAVLISGLAGIITFLIVQSIEIVLEMSSDQQKSIERASIGMFLYLEVLDSSFSFDGVVGAFAISNNLFIIAIGLGIGAMFVRSLTIMMVDKGTLEAFKFMEHGAFWAVMSLAIIMLVNTFTHIPEVITAGLGAAIIGLSIWSSIKSKGLSG